MINKRKGRILALILCLALLLSNTISILAEEMTLPEVAANEIEPAADDVVPPTEEPVATPTETPVEEPVVVLEETEVPEEQTGIEETNSENTVNDMEQNSEEVFDEVQEEVQEEIQTLLYEDDDVIIEVTETTAGAIPEQASLKVVPVIERSILSAASIEELSEIRAINQQYEDAEKRLQDKAKDEDYKLLGFLAYDISLVDGDGNKMEPTSDVSVSMKYKKAVAPADVKVKDVDNTEVTVMHFEENAQGEVANVVDMTQSQQVLDLQTTSTQKIEQTEFVTNSFSVFTITWIRKDGETEVFRLTENLEVLVVDGANYSQMGESDSQVLASLTVESDGTPPTLFADSIAAGGKNEALYNVEANGTTYQFVKMIHARLEHNIIQAVHLEPVVAIQAMQDDNGNPYLRYMLEGTGVYRDETDLPANEFLAFVYMDENTTTSGSYYSEDGHKLSDDVYDFTKLAESADNENGVHVVISTPPGAPATINSGGAVYEYRYVAIEQLGKRIIPTYLRYHTDVIDGVVTSRLQYRMADNNLGQQAEWVDVVDADIRLIYKTSDTITTANTAGVVDIDLFNYNITAKGSGNPGGLIQGLFFGTGWQAPKDKVYNLWTGGVKDADGKLYSNLGVQGIVKDELVNGYPVTEDYIDDGGSLETLFDHSNRAGQYTKDTYVGLNHLFKIEDGYYIYDSGENYAYFNELDGNKNFTIYNEAIKKITPNTDNMSPEEKEAAENRGDFMPFVAKNEGVPSNSNNEDAYHIGMTIGFDFIQPEDGKINGKDMIFKFSGDDDVWVFVDGKLVLDIGGLHNEASGQINFTTGEVVVLSGPIVAGVDNRYGEGVAEAIQIAGDETQAAAVIQPSRISLKDIFGLSGNTFEGNSSHRLEFFYLERGADVTNCAVTFNLQPIKAQDIEVAKEIVNTDQAKYSDVEFTYQLYLEDEVGSGKDDGTGYDLIPEGTKYTLKRDGQAVGTRTVGAKGTFKLKHGESAVFEGINSSLKYYVRELSVSDDRFEAVLVNGKAAQYFDEDGNPVTITQTESNEESTEYIAQSDKVTIKEVHKVLFQNTCAEPNKRNLHIQKLFDGNPALLDENATFSFKLMIEDRDGMMVPYANGNYFVVTEDGEVQGTTGADGIIAGIKVDQIVIIKELMAGTDFHVEEVNLSGEYQTPEKEIISDDEFSYETSDKGDGAIMIDKDAKVEITNALRVDWELIKISSSTNDKGTPLYLKDAEFQLESENGTTITGVSGDDGVVVWNLAEGERIVEGTYTLTEIKAPTGYLLSAKEWTVEIGKTQVKVLDGTTNIANAIKNADGTVQYQIQITNEAVYELPSTGGSGIYWYMISGMMLMMAASVLMLYKNRCKEVLRRK